MKDDVQYVSPLPAVFHNVIFQVPIIDFEWMDCKTTVGAS